MDECIRLHDDRRWTWFFETALRLTWDVHANVGKPYHVGVLQPLCLHAVALVCCTLRYAACGPLHLCCLLHVARCPLRPWPPANVFPAFGRVFLVPCAVRGVFACVRPCAPALHACVHVTQHWRPHAVIPIAHRQARAVAVQWATLRFTADCRSMS